MMPTGDVDTDAAIKGEEENKGNDNVEADSGDYNFTAIYDAPPRRLMRIGALVNVEEYCLFGYHERRRRLRRLIWSEHGEKSSPSWGEPESRAR